MQDLLAALRLALDLLPSNLLEEVELSPADLELFARAHRAVGLELPTEGAWTRDGSSSEQ